MEYYIGLITMAAIQALLGLSVYVLVLAGGYPSASTASPLLGATWQGWRRLSGAGT
jgi:hypothetical protein